MKTLKRFRRITRRESGKTLKIVLEINVLRMERWVNNRRKRDN